jgi:hypothetical protein
MRLRRRFSSSISRPWNPCDGHDPTIHPTIEAALDRALAAMASPTIRRALVARMVDEIPLLSQIPAAEGDPTAMTQQERALVLRRFVRRGGLGVAVAVGLCAALLFPRAQAPQGGAAAAPLAAAAPAARTVLAAGPAQATAPAVPSAPQRLAVAARRVRDAAAPLSGREARTAEGQDDAPFVDPVEATPPLAAGPGAADERVAVTVLPATVRESEDDAEPGADNGTAIPALPAGPRVQGGMGFSGMGDMGAPAGAGLAGGRR